MVRTFQAVFGISYLAQKRFRKVYSKAISLEYYRVALEYRHRFYPVNELALAPYLPH